MASNQDVGAYRHTYQKDKRELSGRSESEHINGLERNKPEGRATGKLVNAKWVTEN